MHRTSLATDEQIVAFPGLVEAYGFIPNLFLLQKELPRAVEGEQGLIRAIARECRLSRRLKDSLFHTVASVRGSNYCRALHTSPHPKDGEGDHALLAFAHKLAQRGPWICKHDVAGVRAAGFDDPVILETVLAVALGQMLCTLANALRPDLDEGLLAPVSTEPSGVTEPVDWVETWGPYLQPCPPLPSNSHAHAFFQEQFGFVPKLFQDQMLRPDVVEAESQALTQILIPEDQLSRIVKENIVLLISAANLNTYFVAVHSQILATLGVPPEDSNQIVENHRSAAISPREVALLDEIRKLACCPVGSETRFESAPLREHGFSEPQILEAVAMAAMTNFLNTVQAGLGSVPDFPPLRVFTRKDLYPSLGPSRLISDATSREDPDAAFVVRVQGGDTGAFEELVRRPINTGTDLLRQRKPCESLDESGADEEFRPRQIQSWADNPEQVLAASQRSRLVREGVLRLPEKYRVVVLLRDISQLSTEEAAAALELSIPAVKARLLRGRLMLRESLAPYFIGQEKRSPDAQLC